MTIVDLIGLGLFAVAFFGYARIADLAGRGKNVNSLMHEVRRAWMQRMMERPDRIVDSARSWSSPACWASWARRKRRRR